MLDIVQVMEGDSTDVVGFFAKGYHSREEMLVSIESHGWGKLIDDNFLARTWPSIMRFIPNPTPRYIYSKWDRGAFLCTFIRLYKRTILVILQYEDNFQEFDGNYYEWFRGFWASSMGKGLKKLLPPCDAKMCCTFPLTTDFVMEEINREKPKIILACGPIAQRTAEEMGLDFVPIPYPEQLSEGQTNDVREELQRRIRCLSQRINV